MTDETPKTAPDLAASPLYEPAAEPTVHAAPAEPPRYEPAPVVERPSNNAPLIGVVVLAVIVVVGGIALWRSAAGSADQVAALQNQLSALQARLASVEARPLPPPPPDTRPLEQRLTTLEQKPPPLAQLGPESQQQIAGISSRIDGVAARQNELGVREQTDVAKLNDQVGALNSQMSVVTKAGTAITALADRQARTARLQMANVALQSGKPLGEIPSAPPALAAFATKPPPTEASLRLSFDKSADDARAAGQPPKDTTPFLSRVWNKAQAGLVIRQGEHVLVGDAVTGILEHSRHLLDAGDLPGAVSALDDLTGPAAAAMAPWRAQAQSLLDARAALISAANG
ncbi:hypothetical protein [Acidisphaera sp. L21]|uniref:hypothetical protein n=1 Tax=Acidisphaera sp. L21 TaxID=1641851 RepID=UPI00131AE748|nr:hypothetical protein [Acidisphaera sp. L21]